jgi:Spy/CpxP family protein refolding chaperone
MKRILLLAALFLGLFAADVPAQPPGGGGGGMGMGGGRGMMGNRPSGRSRFMWMTFCFDLNATDAQVAKAWPIFRETFARQKALEDKYQDDPPEEARNEMQKVQADLEAKVKALLTPEQQQKLAEMESQRQQWRERRGGGGPGGGGPPR